MTAAELIAAERQRQIDVEGWTPEHDADQHGYDDALARAAVCYATPPYHRLRQQPEHDHPAYWPWEPRFWKPCPDDRVRELVKAGALIAAEIDRLQRPTPRCADCFRPLPHTELEQRACWATTHPTDDEQPHDAELPGMWEPSDFTGGRDVVRGPDWEPADDERPAKDGKR